MDISRFGLLVFLCSLFTCSRCIPSNTDKRKFPPGFKIGAATSAYQIEGATEEGGRGESIWDKYIKSNPQKIKDNSSAVTAADSYHRYKDDVQLLKCAGFDHYRFSISWSRILPRGEMNGIKQEGIDYYNKVIDELLANHIEPVVTMYHWDLPQAIQDLGGWSNPLIIDYFEEYAFVLFSNFGDRVKRWITINDPLKIVQGYRSDHLAPGLNNKGGEFWPAHHLILAHAKVYRLYQSEFKDKQRGEVGISILGDFTFPLNGSDANKMAADKVLQFNVGWFAHPIFSKEGNYPSIMREVIDDNSATEKRRRSRLPSFTPEEIKTVKGSSDFFGLNHYSSALVSAKKVQKKEGHLCCDLDVEILHDPSWRSSSVQPPQYVVPTGLRGILNWIKRNYDNPPVFVTENGFADLGGVEDNDRCQYFNEYLLQLLKANRTDKCNVIGYTAWSLLDGFDWTNGFTSKYGITAVDFESPEINRARKYSTLYFKDILQRRELPKKLTIRKPSNILKYFKKVTNYIFNIHDSCN